MRSDSAGCDARTPMIRNMMLAAVIGAGLCAMMAPAAMADPGAAPPTMPAAGCDPHPVMSTHTIPPYPELSRRMYEQGDVVLVVTIDAQGTPTDVAVDKTSGFVRLDDAARDWVRDTWRWPPLSGFCANGGRAPGTITL